MKKITVRLALGLAAAVLASSAFAQDTLKLAVGQRGLWDTSISDVGQRAGIFKKHGLTLELLYTQGAGETQQAVISGSVEIGVGVGIMGVLSAYSKNAPVRIIGAEITGAGDLFWYVKANSPIKTIQDFNGKTIAYSTNGSSTHGVVTAYIKQYGLTAAKATPTGGPPATLTAVMSGQVDVGWSAPPVGLDQLDKNEIRQIATGNDTLFKGQTVRLLITNTADPAEPQGRHRALHEGLPGDDRLDVFGPRRAQDLRRVRRHHRGQGETHPRRVLSQVVAVARPDHRPRPDRSRRGQPQVHRRAADQGAARRPHPDSAAVASRTTGSAVLPGRHSGSREAAVRNP